MSSSDGSDVSGLYDGDFNDVCPVRPSSDGRDWVQFEFPEEVTLKSIRFCKKDDWKMNTGRIGQVSNDGVNFIGREVRMPLTRTPFFTVSLIPATGRFFRISGAAEGEELNYTELRVYPVTRVNMDTEKAGFFTNVATREFYPTPDTEDAVDPGEAVNSLAVGLVQCVHLLHRTLYAFRLISALKCVSFAKNIGFRLVLIP